MANLLVGTPIYSDANQTFTPTFSGGSWSASLPLTNLQDRRLAKVARTSNALTTSTQFVADLKTARAVRLISIPKHNMSLTATIRVTGSANSDGVTSPVYDSGTINVYPAAAGMTAEEMAEQIAQGFNFGFVNIPSSAQTARYWKIAITDTSNSAGYVELGRLVIAAAYQPTINLSYGAKMGFEDSSVRTESVGGAAIFQEKYKRRSLTCILEGLPESEAMTSVYDLQKRIGLTKQCFVVFDSSDVAYMYRRSFLAVMKELSPLEYPYYARNTVPLSFIEEL